MSRYSKETEKLKAPDELRAKTLEAMREAASSPENKEAPREPLPIRRIILGAAAALVVLLASASFLSNMFFIRTKLTAGQHVATVELTNGELNFASPELSLAPGPVFGAADAAKAASQEEFVLKTRVRPELKHLPAGFKRTGESYFLSDSAASASVEYAGADGARVNLEVSCPFSASNADYNSTIGGTALALTYDERSDEYAARFEKSGALWKITGVGVSEEAFIKILRYSV